MIELVNGGEAIRKGYLPIYRSYCTLQIVSCIWWLAIPFLIYHILVNMGRSVWGDLFVFNDLLYRNNGYHYDKEQKCLKK